MKTGTVLPFTLETRFLAPIKNSERTGITAFCFFKNKDLYTGSDPEIKFK